jgi:hypothetical protein
VDDVLYYPAYRNMCAVNAFFVSRVEEILRLTVIQATTGKVHPIKATGLQIINTMCARSNDIGDKILVFLTPKNSHLVVCQPLIMEKDAPSKKIPNDVAAFEENQYKLENNFEAKDDSELQSFYDLIQSHSSAGGEEELFAAENDEIQQQPTYEVDETATMSENEEEIHSNIASFTGNCFLFAV